MAPAASSGNNRGTLRSLGNEVFTVNALRRGSYQLPALIQNQPTAQTTLFAFSKESFRGKMLPCHLKQQTNALQLIFSPKNIISVTQYSEFVAHTCKCICFHI